MKKEKISFNSIKDVLSRDEMRLIMAGSGLEQCGLCFSSGCVKGEGLSCTCYMTPGAPCRS
jgi:hypothetical protein